MTQFTRSSRARRIMSGWSPQMTMLSRSENSRFSRPAGRATVTSPEISSAISPPSFKILPSSTDSRLNTGSPFTMGLRTEIMS